MFKKKKKALPKVVSTRLIKKRYDHIMDRLKKIEIRLDQIEIFIKSKISNEQNIWKTLEDIARRMHKR